MQPEELRKKAKRKVEEKKAFYLTAVVFAAISVLLLIISWQFYGDVAFWIRFPILVLALILGVMYAAIFGVPFLRFMSSGWEEEQIQREMDRMHRGEIRELPPPEQLSEEDKLELQELERLRQKWDYRNEDFV